MNAARYARELHDEAGQSLSVLKIGLDALAKASDQPEFVVAQVNELASLADDLMAGLHRLAANLRPATLDRLGLFPALAQLAESFRQQTGIEVDLCNVVPTGRRFRTEVETTIFRVTQEAMTNIARHAQATHVDIIVEPRDDRVLTIVEDDGIGFDVDTARQSGRLGLLGMIERVKLLEGDLIIESSPGHGTTLYIDLPDTAGEDAPETDQVVPAGEFAMDGHGPQRGAGYPLGEDQGVRSSAGK